MKVGRDNGVTRRQEGMIEKRQKVCYEDANKECPESLAIDVLVVDLIFGGLRRVVDYLPEQWRRFLIDGSLCVGSVRTRLVLLDRRCRDLSDTGDWHCEPMRYFGRFQSQRQSFKLSMVRMWIGQISFMVVCNHHSLGVGKN